MTNDESRPISNGEVESRHCPLVVEVAQGGVYSKRQTQETKRKKKKKRDRRE